MYCVLYLDSCYLSLVPCGLLSCNKVYIAPDAFEFAAFEGRVFEYPAEAFFGHCLPFSGRKIKYFGDRCESNLIVRLAKAVPRAYILAYITPKHPVLKLVFH